jgi:hypothetical protein
VDIHVHSFENVELFNIVCVKRAVKNRVQTTRGNREFHLSPGKVREFDIKQEKIREFDISLFDKNRSLPKILGYSIGGILG